MFKKHLIAMGVAAALAYPALAAGVSGTVSTENMGWVGTETLAHRMVQATPGVEVAQSMPLHVTVSLRLRNKADLDSITTRIAKSGGHAPHISHQEFMARFAPSQAQVEAVVQHLRSTGFTRITVAPNHLLVTAEGNAATAKAAFHTTLHHYNLRGRTVYANVNSAMVPAHLGGTVQAVLGLQNAHVYHTMMRVAARPKAHLRTADASAGTVTGHNPTDFPTIYNAGGLQPASGTTVGIISEGDLTQTLQDLNQFASSAGFATPNTSTVLAGSASSDTSGTGEWNLDSQDILAAAGGSVQQMVFYVAASMSNADLTAAYNKAVSDNQAKVINVSLGECEDGAASDGSITADDQIFQSAIAQGQIFSVSSGDSGSDECGDGSNHQSYPASSPYVIAVGGTTVGVNNDGTYAGETVWNGGGGGISSQEAAPSWQAGVLNGSTQRGVPDVSFDADPNSGALVLVNGQQQQIGGTSLASPLFVGFWARIESANNNGINFPAKSLYAYIPQNANAVNDVTSGSNGAWSASTGWDYATGWGSLNVGNMANLVNSTSGF